jgi:major membrane immunogen (membrane-anchored lipoprotein)
VERYIKIPEDRETLVILPFYFSKELVYCGMIRKHFALTDNRPLLRLASLFLALILISSCTCKEDNLDSIKDFRPEDKYFKSSLVSLHFVMETSPIEEVDTLFAQLIKLYDLPISPLGLNDGTFTGASPYDAFDYKHEVTLKIEDGRIIELDYNEVNKNGVGKQEDKAYCEDMSVTGTSPAIAYPIYENELLRTQNILDVDAVSGASYSLYRFRYAITIALMKASL